ncbi:MAG: hypothetical protein JWP81_2729 [Ferruginibacter sp.]|nr:hypothetical protein [Ferruginibacter sp.]
MLVFFLNYYQNTHIMKKLFPFPWIEVAFTAHRSLRTLLLSISVMLTSVAIAAPSTTYTIVSSSLNPSTVGAAVTFTATVKDNGFFIPQIVNEGTVTFSDGATVLAADVPVIAGVASFSTSALAAGNHVIVAVYSGSANLITSTGSIAQTVDGTDPCPTYAGNIAYVNGAAAVGTNDGTTWARAFLTLQAALDAARTCGVTQIWVAQGTYAPTACPIGLATDRSGGLLTNADFSFHLINGVAIYGGFSGSGSETLLSQRNWRQNSTILSGSNTSYHVVTSANDGSSTRLDGFTVTGANANGNGFLTAEGGSFGRSIGGGVVMYGSSPRLENLLVTGNAASSIGGIYATNGSPTLTNVAVLNHPTGGMAYITAGTGFVITMTNVVFAGNSTSGGGGLQLNGFTMTANLTNVVFANNSASRGGGLLNAACNTNLVNCTFYNNSVDVSGGAMYNVNGATVNDKNGIYYNNNNGNTAYNGVFNFSIDVFNATTTFSGNPLFVNPADPDGPDNIWMTADDGLSIQSTSPAINAGTLAGAPTTDIRGFARTGNPDQGAYEYGVNSTITTSGTLTTFTTCAGIASAEQTFSVSGTGLTANLDVAAPAGFEVSLTTGSGFATSVSLTPSSGTVNTTTIFVRLAALASGDPSGTITASSTGVTPQNVAVNGSVKPVPTGIIPAVSAICSGSFVDVPLSIAIISPFPQAITGLYFTWSIGTVTGGITGAVDGTSSVTGLYEGIPIHQLLDNPGTAQGSVQYNITPVLTYSPSLVCPGQAYSVIVPVNPFPTAAISGTVAICNNTSTNLSIQFTGTAPFKYSINGGTLITASTNPEIVSVSPSSTTNYSVTSLTGAGCTARAGDIAGTATITVNTLSIPPTGATGTTTICNGAGTTLTVSGGSKGTGAITEWFTGSCDGISAGTGDAITVSPVVTTTYYIRYKGICNTTSCATVTVMVNQTPTLSCPGNITINNTTGLCSGVATYLSPSTGTPAPTISYTFAGATTGSGSGNGSGKVFNVGITTVTITATNSCGSASCSFTVTVKDIQPPVINEIAKPIVLLWSPSHSYQTITASQFITSVTDNCGTIPVANVVITKVTSDEAEDAAGDDGNTLKDIVIATNCKSVQLRSERMGGGNGRVYTIYVAVKDVNGNTGTATFKVFVAASQNGTTAVDNITPLYTMNSSCSGIASRAVAIIPEADDNPGVPTIQAYPNPFSSSATIHYILPKDAHISLAVYNQLGQKVAVLQEGRMSAGSHYQKLDGTKLAAGFYICRLVTRSDEGKLIQLNEKLVITK